MRTGFTGYDWAWPDPGSTGGSQTEERKQACE